MVRNPSPVFLSLLTDGTKNKLRVWILGLSGDIQYSASKVTTRSSAWNILIVTELIH